jgi:hypothetical protein
MTMRVKKAKFNDAGASSRFGTVLPHIYWNFGTKYATERFFLGVAHLR